MTVFLVRVYSQVDACLHGCRRREGDSTALAVGDKETAASAGEGGGAAVPSVCRR